MEKDNRTALSANPTENGQTQEYLINGIRVRLNFLPKASESGIMAEIQKTLLASVSPDALTGNLA